MRVLFAFLLLAGIVAATSSGLDTTCTVLANFGCAEFGPDPVTKVISRKYCKDSNATVGIMPWVTKPVYSTNYTLRAGDRAPFLDKTTYTPGVMMDLFVRTHNYRAKWRGIIVHAIDKDNKTVGEWVFPPDDNNILHTPCKDKGVALHVSAEIKPFLVRMTWVPPKAGTGTVTFKALIKEGPANEGQFYWPGKTDFTLAENPAPAPTPIWQLAAAGKTCGAHCTEQSKSCVSANLNSQAEFELHVGPFQACNLPLVSTCSASKVDPGSTMCYYHDAQTCSLDYADATVPSDYCWFTPKKHERLLCYCSQPGAVNAASSYSVSPVLLLLLSLVSFFATPSSSASSSACSRRLLFLGIALCLCQSAFAHNWMHTSGRATRQASTQRPCAARKASDTHVQVGPSQEFAFKWATGHGGFTWVILIKGEDYDWLGHRDFQKYLDDYIQNAPNGTDTSKTAKWRRYHGSRTDLSGMIGSHFKGNVSKDTVPHPETNMFGFMYDFTDAKLASDYRVSYKSAKYPWLLMVGKFQHDTDRAGDNDGINMMIPAGSAPGHYIAHWRWSGYYDCVDIDYRPSAINETMIYGAGNGGFTFDRVDHCSVVNPQLVVTPFVSATEGIESCLNALEKGSGSFGQNVAGHGRPTQRIALAVVPSTMPETVPVPFQHELGIPDTEENDSLLYQTEWLRLKGTDSASADNWGAWQKDLVANVTCTNVTARVTTTLRDAVIRCGRADCLGIAFPANIDFAARDKTYAFSLCKDTATKADATASVAWKKPVAPPAEKLGTTISVSFSQASLAIPNDPKYLSDVGLEYGPKGSYKYGWLCNITSRTYGGFFNNKTQETSYISMPYQTCESVPPVAGLPARNRWEIEVPSGVYNVTFLFINYGNGCTTPGCRDIDTQTCALENMLVHVQGFRNKLDDTYEKTVQVEVTDGKLTLSSVYSYYGKVVSSRCEKLSTMTIQRVADALPGVWFPSSTNPWYQTALPVQRKVGYVYLVSPTFNALDTPGTRGANWPDAYSPMNTCDSWHLWKSNRCYDNQPADLFTSQFEGATVGVSNTPCTGQTCSGTVCGRVQISWLSNTHEAATGVRGRLVFGRPFIDCKGAVGQYLWVQLPGANRILNVVPMFTTPELPKNALVCYGVVPRYPTELEPEYITSNDPEDPVFYSTCYMRELDKTWQFPVKSEGELKTWRFSGKCIDCPSYSRAENNFTLAPLGVQQPVAWKTTTRCVNCDSTKIQVKEPLVLVNETASCNSTTASAQNCLKTVLTEDNRPVTSAGQCSVVTRSSPGCGPTFVYSSNLCQCYLAACGTTCSLVKHATATVYKLN